MRLLPFICLIGFGCGGSSKALPESDSAKASHIFAVAQELDKSQKIRQAMNAYHQLVRDFPESPEAKKAAARIAQAQIEAIQKVSSRKSR